MLVERRVFPPFIAKRVEGISGYDILLYGFLFRRQWGRFSRSFARIGLLFIKRRRVQHKPACARTFLVRLARTISCAALIYTQKTRKNIYLCFALFSMYLLYSYMFQKWLCLLVFLEYAHMYNINIYWRM